MNLFFSIQGRIGRLKYWLAQLIIAPFAYILYYLLDSIENSGNASLMVVTILIIPIILIAWVGTCVLVKRYHDRDKSGFWVFLIFIPIIGPIWQFIECGLLAGTFGNNDYGPMPKSIIGSEPSVDDQISKLHTDAKNRWNEQPNQQDTGSSQQSGSGKANRPSGFGRRNT